MPRQPWLDRVDVELGRRGVPARFRTRLLAELRDHLDDLMEGGSRMITEEIESRVGPPDALATVAAEEYRRASWVHRHPFVVFGLAPVPLLAMLIVGFVLLAVAMGTLIQLFGVEESRTTAVTGALALHHGIRFIPFAVGALLFGWWAVRFRVLWKWLALATAQITLVAGIFASQLTLSEVPGQSAWSLSFILPGFQWGQWIQLALPLAVGLVLIEIARRRTAIAA